MIKPDLLEAVHKFITVATNMKVPFLFKGAVVLDILLKSTGSGALERGTKDLDADFISGDCTADKMFSIVQEVAQKMGNNFSVVEKRKLDVSKGKSGGYIFSKDGKESFRMDIGIKSAYGMTHMNLEQVQFWGASKERMVIDKACATSTRYVFRRAKDLLDLSYLSLFPYTLDELKAVLVQSNLLQKFGTFYEFQNCVEGADGIRHAFNKLEWHTPENRPDFDAVYKRVSKFIHPFIQDKSLQSVPNHRWDESSGEWVSC
jgi:hypothetical protein